jgi:uncharacterized membrane protein YdjX (TVP38/TMEM64 family)
MADKDPLSELGCGGKLAGPDGRPGRGRSAAFSGGRLGSVLGVLKRFGPLLVVAAALIVIVAMGWHRHITLENIAVHRDTLRDFTEQHKIAAVLVFAGVYIAVVALSLPGALILTISGGLLFGAALGAIVTVLAATAGATLVFLIAKTSVGESFTSVAGPWLEKLREGFEKEGVRYMLFLRLVPFPFVLVNLAPALIGVSLRTFVIGTFFGIIPGTVTFSFLGYTLDQIIAKAKAGYDACVAAKGAAACELSIDGSELPITQIFVALALIGILSLIPTLVRKWRNSHAATE